MNTESDLMAALAALRSRGEIKRFGVAVDRDNKLRALLERAAERRGLDSAAASKKLIRGLLDRASSAQIRTNPIHVDEPFNTIKIFETSCKNAVGRRGGKPVTRIRKILSSWIIWCDKRDVDRLSSSPSEVRQ